MSDWESDGEEDRRQTAKPLHFSHDRSNNNGYDRSRNERSVFRVSSGFRGRGRGRGGCSTADLTVSIDGRDRSRLIGRGGASIRHLENSSGTRICIRESNTHSSLPSAIDVDVFGSEKQCSVAKRLIEEHLGYEQPDAKAEQEKDDDYYQVDWDAIRLEHAEKERLRWAKCPPLRKSFYEEHAEVTAMTEAQVDAFRQESLNIEISKFKEEAVSGKVSEADDDKENTVETGDDVDKEELLKPCVKFEHAFHLFPDILHTISRQNFEKPSPIQSQMWPYLMSGKDVIGIAQTGTGKTLAFLLPAFIHIVGQPVPRHERGGPNVLVLSPTRELALQIAEEVKKYDYRGIKSVCVYGGGNRREQMKIVTEGVEIIIATPGRLNDLIEAECIRIESVTYLVLDEADRMLDLGFEPQIRKVLLDIRPDRQTVMTSATWPVGVRRMASSYMSNPVTVCVGSLDLQAVQCVTQTLKFLETDQEKRAELMDFLVNMKETDKVIIFVGRKARADDLSSDLSIKDIVCQSIHGNREQSDREQALQDLRTGEVKVLVATDVASRGIDIIDITHVINYDFPRDIEEYVHRVGRTGRAGREGEAITFVSRDNWKHAKELIKILTEANQVVPQDLINMAQRYAHFLERKASERSERVAGGGSRGRGRGGRGDRHWY